MKVYLIGHDFLYEMENLVRLFFPCDRIEMIENAVGHEDPGQDDGAWLTIAPGKEDTLQYTVKAALLGQTPCERQDEGPATDPPAEQERRLGVLLFTVLQTLTGQTPAWGIITGVHPVKLLRQKSEEVGLLSAEAFFRDKWLVSDEKIALMRRVLKVQEPYVALNQPNSCSLYLSVPFCPSRCSYCSFISQAVEGAKKLIEPYVTLLLREIEETAAIARQVGLQVQSVYIGGGTPTTFSASQLTAVIEKVRERFDLSHCVEFTVEAGRPDTVTKEKLQALLSGGVTRISINPQSMHNDVLRAIGRRHTAQDVVEAFHLAQRLGFSNINADLIVGLPGDDLTSFQRTLDGVIQLGASNVTVHSLAIKRSARLNSPGGDLSAHSNAQEAAAMVDYSIQRLTQEGFEPYYLYRQTRMAGNLENTGWAKPGSICRYNIYTMDESNTVIACGAGGVSKVKDPYSGRLERIFNFKLPLEYINRFPEILQRKDGVTALYEQFRQRLR